MTEPLEDEVAHPSGASSGSLRSLTRKITVDVSPLRASPAFRNLLIGDAVSVVGTQVTAVAIPLQVYALTRSAGMVGLVGLAGLVPLIVFGLYGGAVADAVDRRKLVLVTTSLQAVLSALLFLQAITHFGHVWVLFVIVGAQAGLFALDQPARGAFIPRLLPPDLLPAANALRQVEFNIGTTGGPLLAGALIALAGFSPAYGLDALSFSASLFAVASLPSMAPEGGGRPAGLASVVEGLRFLATRKVLLLTFVLDIIAMVFGMPRTLFGPLADRVFHAGPGTAGAMYSAIAAGALLGALFGGWLGRIHRQGLAVVLAILAWGSFILLFGTTSHLWFALLMLAGAGASDMVSAVFRSAILQTAAPDEMRGRLGGVFIVVVAGGPRLGDARVGGFASAFGLQESVITGGVIVLVLTLLVVAVVPRFIRYDSRNPVA